MRSFFGEWGGVQKRRHNCGFPPSCTPICTPRSEIRFQVPAAPATMALYHALGVPLCGTGLIIFNTLWSQIDFKHRHYPSPLCALRHRFKYFGGVQKRRHNCGFPTICTLRAEIKKRLFLWGTAALGLDKNLSTFACQFQRKISAKISSALGSSEILFWASAQNQ